MNKGDLWEQDVSLYYHQKFTPVLISSEFCRKFGAGQVDVCVLNKKINCLYLIECKAGGILDTKQKRRLKRSANLLSSIFDKSIILKICQKKAD